MSRTPGAAVLMYHGVGTPASRGEDHYTVSARTFRRQLEILASRPRATLEDLLKGLAGGGAAIITFDDGERSVVTEALPMMKAAGLTGALFVTTTWINREGYVTDDDLRVLAEEGWIIGAHGATHRYLSDLSPQELREELVQSRDRLTMILGSPPWHMSLPGGRATRRVIRAVGEAGYVSLCTSAVGHSAIPPTDPFGVRRMMVLGSWGEDTFHRIVSGDRMFMLRLQARQELLGVAKRTLGNAMYDRLRGAAFSLGRRG